MRKIACGALLASALLIALASPALAQPTPPATPAATEPTFVERRTVDGQDIRFGDDPVGALSHDPIGAQLTGFHPPRRFDLMRPRWTFIPELLTSIVHM